MNLTDNEVQQIENHLSAITSILNRYKSNSSKTMMASPTVELIKEVASKGAIFYLGHGIPLENAKVSINEKYGFALLNGKYECYSNGCCFFYSLYPHDEKVRIEYKTPIPNKTGYYY